MCLIDLIKKRNVSFIFEPMTKAQINQAEKELNVNFAKEYADYVAEFGVAIFDGHELTGLCDGKRLDVVHITQEQRNLNKNIPDDWYVVECVDVDGIVIWQNSKGAVYAAVPNSKAKKIANSISEYIGK